MITISLNNILADVPPQPDTFIDEYYEFGGRQHMVWREYDNGSYLIKYANNIDGNLTGIENYGLSIVHNTTNEVSNPQIAIDQSYRICYVIWIESNSEFWYSGSYDFENWTMPMFGGAYVPSSGDPMLEVSVSSLTLYLSWRNGGELTVNTDLDGDYIPDSSDEHIFVYDTIGDDAFYPDVVAVDKDLGVSVAIDYDDISIDSPSIESTASPEILDGAIGTYVDINTASNESFTAVIKFEYDSTSLPSAVIEKYLCLYHYDEAAWAVLGNTLVGENTGVDLENEYVWGITSHFSVFAPADSMKLDSDLDGIRDGEEMNKDYAPFSSINLLSDYSAFKNMSFNETSPQQTVSVDIPDYVAAMEYVVDAKLVINGTPDAVDIQKIFSGSTDYPSVGNNMISVEAADFDGDEDEDLITLSRDTLSYPRGYCIHYSENIGNGIFSSPELVNFSIMPIFDIYLLDLDNDGNNDIGARQSNGGVGFFGGNGDGTFNEPRFLKMWSPQNPYSYTIGYLEIAFIDYNLDGLIDILTFFGDDPGYLNMELYENNLDFQFSFVNSVNLNVFCPNNLPVEVTDFDNDGLNDVMISLYDGSGYLDPGQVVFIKNLGDGDFTNSAMYDVDMAGSYRSRVGDFAVCDFDNDGDKDFAVTNSIISGTSPYQYDDYLRVYFNNGDGTFDNSFNYEISSESHRSMISVADFDKDSFTDIAFIELEISDYYPYSWYGYVSILPNNGDETFASIIRLPADPRVSDILITDIDNDYGLDIFTPNNGSGSFSHFENKGVFMFECSIDIGGEGYEDWSNSRMIGTPVTTSNFIAPFNEYIKSHPDSDGDGQITVPIEFNVTGNGTVNIEYVSIMVGTYDTNPNIVDTDEDGLFDGEEFNNGYGSPTMIDELLVDGTNHSEAVLNFSSEGSDIININIPVTENSTEFIRKATWSLSAESDEVVSEITFDIGSYADIDDSIYSFQEEQPIFTSETHCDSPAIYEDKVVYTDFRYGNMDIFMYDLMSEEEVQLSFSPVGEGHPEIWGDYVLWYRSFPDKALILKNYVTGEERIFNEGVGDIYGDYVVYQSTVYGGIALYEISSSTTTGISGDRYGNLCIFDDYVAHTDSNTGSVWLYTISDGSHIEISPSGIEPILIDASDKYVIYSDALSNNDLYSYEISTGENKRITNDLEGQNHPTIYGSIALWTDYRNSEPGELNTDIYGYDLDNDIEFPVCLSDGIQSSPAIYEDTIAFISYIDGGDWQICITERIPQPNLIGEYETWTAEIVDGKYASPDFSIELNKYLSQHIDSDDGIEDGFVSVPIIVSSNVASTVTISEISILSDILITNPAVADSDGDGLDDGQELNVAGIKGGTIDSLIYEGNSSEEHILDYYLEKDNTIDIEIPSSQYSLIQVTEATMDIKWNSETSNLWETPRLLDLSGRPSIISDYYGRLHVVWAEEADYDNSGTDSDIFHKMWNGTVWTEAMVISTESTEDSSQPTVKMDERDGTIYLAWVDNTDYNGAGFDSDIFYKKWNGTVWSAAEVVSSESTGDVYSPSIAIDSKSNVHIAWVDNTDYPNKPGEPYIGTDLDIVYRTINETYWNDTTIVSWDIIDDCSPVISVDSMDRIHVMWATYYQTSAGWYQYRMQYGRQDDTVDLGWARVSFYDSISKLSLIDGDAQLVDMKIDSNDVIHTAWSAHDINSNSDFHIYYTSCDSGVWSDSEIISDIESDAYWPQISIGYEDSLHIAWTQGGIKYIEKDVEGWHGPYNVYTMTGVMVKSLWPTLCAESFEGGLTNVLWHQQERLKGTVMLKSIKSPMSVEIDIGYDGDVQWLYEIGFDEPSQIIDFSNEINEYIYKNSELTSGNISIPIRVSSGGYGNVNITNVSIKFDVLITDPTSEYSDDDSMSDGEELEGWTATRDINGDGDTDDVNEEYIVTSNPTLADSDFDGVPDDIEKHNGTDPTNMDTDFDGLDDYEEMNWGMDNYITDGRDADTDGDFYNDLPDVFPTNPTGASDNDYDELPDIELAAPDWTGLILTEDLDDDNDGVPDIDDDFHFNPTGTTDTDNDGKPNIRLNSPWWFADDPLVEDWDDDNDGVPDYGLNDTGQNNIIRDGIGEQLTSHQAGDRDGKYDPGEYDEFPLVATEWLDTDNDGIGNKADTDDDGDEVPDSTDDFPYNHNESCDTDVDGTGNNADGDDDTNDTGEGDGIPDDGFDGIPGNSDDDAFPLNPTGAVDTDKDGLPDITLSAPQWFLDKNGITLTADPDDDNDGVKDYGEDGKPGIKFVDDDGINGVDDEGEQGWAGSDDDIWPLNPTGAIDTDGDGKPDVAYPAPDWFTGTILTEDLNDDNDGANDVNDAFPLDEDEWLDTDGDGFGNNADTDDDGDGLPDYIETNSKIFIVDEEGNVIECGSNPLNPDSDGDGLLDGEEYYGWTVSIEFNNDKGIQLDDLEYPVISNPLKKNSDGDSLNDFWEKKYGTDPGGMDSDGDKINDGDELIDSFGGGWLVRGVDSDGDGTSNGPTDYCSIGDGMSDYARTGTRGNDLPIDDPHDDDDGDGISNWDEWCLLDNDDDGLTNGHEWNTNFNPDPDGDVYRTSYKKFDTDEDGLADGGDLTMAPSTPTVNIYTSTGTVTNYVTVKVSKECSPETYLGENPNENNLVELGLGETDPLNPDMDDDGAKDGDDMDPLVDLEVTVKIDEIQKLDTLRDYPLIGDSADFYVWVHCTAGSSNPIFEKLPEMPTTYDFLVEDNDHIYPDVECTFYVPDNQEEIEIVISLWDDDDSQKGPEKTFSDTINSNDDPCDISINPGGGGDGNDWWDNSLILDYNLKTGQWSGDDGYDGDPNGYGHANGSEDGSDDPDTDENDCEIWFDIWQGGDGDDEDGLTWWQEVRERAPGEPPSGTNPTDDDTDGDGAIDGNDFEPLDKSISGTKTIETFTYDEDDHLEESDGVLISKFQSISNSYAEANSNIVKIYAYSFGIDVNVGGEPGDPENPPIYIGIGGSCWAYGTLGEDFALPFNHNIAFNVDFTLNGEIDATVGPTNLKGYFDIYKDGVLYNSIQFLNEEESTSWSTEALQAEISKLSLLSGQYVLWVRFEAVANAFGEYEHGLVDFSDMNGEEYFISINSIQVCLV